MQIRDFVTEDAHVYQAFRLAALRECPSAFASSYEEEHQTLLSVVAERLSSKEDRCVLGAWLDSSLVGMVGLQREEMRKLAHKAFIWGMYVAAGCAKARCWPPADRPRLVTGRFDERSASGQSWSQRGER